MDRKKEINLLGFPLFMDRVGEIDFEIYGRNGNIGNRKKIMNSLGALSIDSV